MSVKKVIIVIKWISHYRMPFYEALRLNLNSEGIELVLIYGEPINDVDRRKKDWVDILWGVKVPNVSIGISRSLIWQPVLHHLKDADLIIVEHANKILLNYFLQIKCLFSNQKLAFWGHGRNYQSSNTLASGLKEKWKSFLMLHVDWWFAYNELCTFEVGKKGFPVDKITSVENAVDTAGIKRLNADVSAKDILAFRERLQINGANVAVFCGGMFNEKRLPFLLASAMEVRKRIPDFELILVGAGIDQRYVENASKVHSWIHYLGPLFGKDKVLAMTVAQIYLIPGAIGLGVLDAFALELPVITTDYKFHGPEYSYVKDNENGIITNDNLHSFVDAVTELFMNHDLMLELKAGCKKASEKYTIENMAKNFSDGVVKCLSD